MGKLGYIITEKYRKGEYQPPRATASATALIRQRMQIETLNAQCIAEPKKSVGFFEKTCAVLGTFAVVFLIFAGTMPLQTTRAMAVISEIIIPDFWETRSPDKEFSGRYIILDDETQIRGTRD